MSPHFILLLALWPVAEAVLSEEIEIDKNYMTPIQVCTYITAPNVTTIENGLQLLNLEGKVSVIFKLTPIVQYQHQVAMFQRLWSRFVRNGFEHLNFVLITSAGNYDKNVLKLFTSDISSYVTNNVTIIEEEMSDENAPHLLLRGNQVIVVDQCQRLTYLVVPPWSFIEYPYVKASVLSTIYDNPCECYDGPQANPLYPYGIDDYTNFYQGFNATVANESNNTNSDDRFSKMTTNSDFPPQNHTDVSAKTTLADELATEIPAEIFANDFNASNVSKNFLEDIEEMVRQDINVLNNDSEQNLQVLDEYPDASQNPNEDIEDISNYVLKSNHNESVDTEFGVDEANFTIPMLKITLPTLHMHQTKHENGTIEYTKYEYIVLQMGDPNYHAHHEGDGEVLREIKFIDDLDGDLPPPSSNHIQPPSGPKWDVLRSKTDRVFVNQQGDVYRSVKEFKVKDQVFEELQNVFIEITQNVETKDESSERQDDMKRHYEKLVPWLSYRLKA